MPRGSSAVGAWIINNRPRDLYICDARNFTNQTPEEILDFKFIVDLFKELMSRFPLQLKSSAVDRRSPYFCDFCNRMSMTLIHTGIKQSIKTALGPQHRYHGLFYCKCGKLKVTQVEPQKIAPPVKLVQFVKELKAKGVIVEHPDGVVKYHLEKFHQNQ